MIINVGLHIVIKTVEEDLFNMKHTLKHAACVSTFIFRVTGDWGHTADEWRAGGHLIVNLIPCANPHLTTSTMLLTALLSCLYLLLHRHMPSPSPYPLGWCGKAEEACTQSQNETGQQPWASGVFPAGLLGLSAVLADCKVAQGVEIPLDWQGPKPGILRPLAGAEVESRDPWIYLVKEKKKKKDIFTLTNF